MLSLQKLKQFRRSESGLTLPLLGLSAMVIIGFVGISVDIARLQLVQSRLSFALDAAGLAAGSTFNTTNLSTELQKYMQANFPANYMGATTPTIQSTVSSDNNIIDLTASTKMPTVFMGIFGITEMDLQASSQVTRQANGLEVVMALDVTGSMSGSKLTSMKNAATSLVNILYGSKTVVPDLWVGLVPFSQAVNIGTSNSAWVDQTHFTSLDWGPPTSTAAAWSGCVMAREEHGRDITDDPPSVEKYKAYYTPSTDNRPYPYNSYYYTNRNKWIIDRDPLTYTSYITNYKGPNRYCPSSKIVPMTSNKSTILNGINAMVAEGMTHINLGAAWAWNMLSPRWRGTWGGQMATDGLPLDYGTKHMSKAAIILTDGNNTMNNYDYTAYGYLSDGNLGTTYSSTATSKLNSKLSAVCASMKDKGIFVYTIVLGSPGSTTENLMKGCATAENYYFKSPSSSELMGVFNTIADSLSNLRISK